MVPSPSTTPAPAPSRILLQRATAAGLVPRLRTLVAQRRHPMAVRHLGEPVTMVLVNRMIPDVLAGDPGPFARTVGDELVDRISAEVGLYSLLDTLLNGELGQ